MKKRIALKVPQEVKPCPFCGSHHIYWNFDDECGGWLECADCHMYVGLSFTDADKEENIHMWNSRETEWRV